MHGITPNNLYIILRMGWTLTDQTMTSVRNNLGESCIQMTLLKPTEKIVRIKSRQALQVEAE